MHPGHRLYAIAAHQGTEKARACAPMRRVGGFVDNGANGPLRQQFAPSKVQPASAPLHYIHVCVFPRGRDWPRGQTTEDNYWSIWKHYSRPEGE